MILTIVIVGILFIVGLLIFAKVDSAAENLLDPSLIHVANETLGTITVETENFHNSTLIAQAGYITNSERVYNNSGAGVQLVRNVDYSIAILLGPSGALTAIGNFTLLNVTNSTAGGSDGDTWGFNDTELNIFYNRNTLSAAQITTNTIESTVLDSFELGVIVLIVLAAVVILAFLFRLGTS